MGEKEMIEPTDSNFFEGVEKLLEIRFQRTAENKNADLRLIPRDMWDALLKTVRCEIISFIRNNDIDAYVLSESSMFVSKSRWILKTCGTTTPLQCLKPMLGMASKLGGYAEIEELNYSRKNFKKPEQQFSPHRGFEEEAAFLDSVFDDGHAYCMGKMNGECWYLYTLSREGRTMEIANNLINNNSQLMESQKMPDQTIEILMTDLDLDVMSIFSKAESMNNKDATEKSGIHKLIPGMVIDDFLFEPCGYSMNGLLKYSGKAYSEGCYMTIHITPEPGYSYVSFESNYAASSYSDLIERVINTFQPGKFVVTVFANKASQAFGSLREQESQESFGAWERQDIHFCRFASYDLTYAQYCKYPS